MSYILSVYSTKAFKEILLPAIDNSDYSLFLQCSLFGFSNDVEINMEIMDGKWRICDSKDYSFTYVNTKEEYKSNILKNGDVLAGNFAKSDVISIIVRETDTSFGVMKKYSLRYLTEITIGNDSSNTFSYNFHNLVSGLHARIIKKGNNILIEDRGLNGIFINSKRAVGTSQLAFGDIIDIYGLKLVFLDEFIAVNTYVDNLKMKEDSVVEYEPLQVLNEEKNEVAKSSRIIFHRSPRNIPKLEVEPVEIEGPPAPKELREVPTIMAIGPALTMALPMAMGCLLTAYASRARGGSSAFMFTGLITAIGSAVVGTIWAIVNMRHARKTNREDELKRFESYSQYLIECANDIKKKYENNKEALNTLYKPTANCIIYNENSVELWNRNSRHNDFLSHRLGVGAIPFQVEIRVPKERFTLINDSLADRPKMIAESYKMLQNVPVCVNLFEKKLIGLIGGDNRRGCYDVMRVLAAQIAANNCYTDVKLVFISDDSLDDGGEQWEFAKWLPHVWSEDKKTRYIARNRMEASEVFYEITNVLRQRADGSNQFETKKVIYKPYYVLFIENPEFLEGELIASYIANQDENYGMTAILMAQGYEELPNICEFIIENTARYQGMYGVADGENDKVQIQYDIVPSKHMENFARKLSNFEVSEIETGGEIPNVLTFFDMYDAKHLEDFKVLERWKKNRTYDSLKALVGQKAGGVDCYLDVHEKYHGPHGLVAGTTGSGKSETLQTYMLSLALNYSPNDVGFFVIDYKGGGMANLFKGLPHMLGQISNLSGNQVRRAMVSIKAENIRRQRIFSEHGVNNINLYTRLYKNKEASIPVPHLFIIIDEFAELKREEPEFMRELISVAQVGRSLGVHLILATQKPAGTVDDNIWSNSKFRLCLRVQDRQDSNDMLHKPDAAYITQAGRCYMQVGNDELFELFQSAWSGAIFDENEGNVKTNIARMLSENGKTAIIGSHAKIKLKDSQRISWIKQLLTVVWSVAFHKKLDILTCTKDSTLMSKLITAFYEEAFAREIEYADTDYNTNRLNDLINVYADILVEDKHSSVVDEEVAKKVIARAILSGKKLPQIKEKTQLDALVEYLDAVAKQYGYVNNLKLWLPVLPTELYLDELSGYDNHKFDGNNWPAASNSFTLDTMIGLYDDPVNQAQNPIYIDLASHGNHAVIGTIASGKSTFLSTYIYSLTNRYSPDIVNLYVLDYSAKMLGAYVDLPHLGGIMYENDDEKVSKFFTMLEQMLLERKKLFQGGSFSQYIRANGTIVPAIVVVIDNVASFRAKTNSFYDDLILNILKEGTNYGIFFVVTAAGFAMNEIPSRMVDSFRTVICLEMNDKYAYGDALRTMHLEVLPEENVKGRGLAKVGDSILEYQTALCIKAEDDYKRGILIGEHCKRMKNAWGGKNARRIPEIPENAMWSDFIQLEDSKEMLTEGRLLPIGYNKKDATVYGIDLAKTYKYIISGKSRTGKTNAMRLMIAAAKAMHGRTIIIDFDSELKQLKNESTTYIESSKELFEYFKQISEELGNRSSRKKELLATGISDESIFEKMQEFDKVFIFIANLSSFITGVHKPQDDVANITDFLCNVLDKGNMSNIYWFACFNQDDVAAVTGLPVYTQFIKEKKGMHLGGNLSAQRLLPIDYVPFNEQAKTVKPGVAYLTVSEADDTTQVVLPLYVGE